MAERQRYVRPEVYEVLLDVSQAVLAPCKSGAPNARDGNRRGWCNNTCKSRTTKTAANSRAGS